MDVFARISKAINGSVAQLQSSHSRLEQLEVDNRAEERSRRQRKEEIQQNVMAAFKDNWRKIQASLLSPDQAAMHHGITRTDLKERLHSLSDALVSEANHSDDDSGIAGPCMEALLEGDLLGRLVKLTANDRIAGSQAEVVRLFASLIILLDERFLSRQAVHRPLVRLMRICVGDEFFNSQHYDDDHEDEEVKAWRRFGRDGSAALLGFEEDLVNMMCHVASRLRNTPELLIIFFRDRGGDAEAKRAFNRALTASAPPSKPPTRSTSPSGSTSSSTINKTKPMISSPLRPPESLPVPLRKEQDASSNTSSSASLTYDFPLFSYLLRFIHRESRTGELARAGLLFLVDVAFAPGRKNLGREQQRTTGQVAKGGRGGMAKKTNVKALDFGLGPSLALARYMLDSDFAEVLGASLGAVYGLLPTKLAASRQSAAAEKDELSGMSLGGSVFPNAEAETLLERGIALNTSEEVRKQSRLLCDLLESTQDILRTVSKMPAEAPGGEDKKRTYTDLVQVAHSLTTSIGSSIQKLYLENILYPALLECSDHDGSAVAVMTYLDLMLGVLESDGVLSDFIVGWLIGEEERIGSTAELGRKRKSTAMLQLEREKGGNRKQSDYFSDALGRYTLRDLLLDYVKIGTRPDAVVAAYNLAGTVMVYYGRFSLQKVLQVVADDAATAFPGNTLSEDEFESGQDDNGSDSDEFVYPGASKDDDLFAKKLQSMNVKAVSGISIAQHAREVRLYLSLANMIERGIGVEPVGEEVEQSSDSVSTGFDNYLADAEQAISRDSMFNDGLREVEGDKISYRHTLNPSDGILRALLSNLCRFWQNSPEVNVALTGFITHLIACPMRGLDGFLVFGRKGIPGGQGTKEINQTASASAREDDFSDDEKEHQRKLKAEKADKENGCTSSPPILLCILRALVGVLDQYRPELSGFGRLLAERRKGLLYVENLNEALKISALADGADSFHQQPSLYEMAYSRKLWESVRIEAEVTKEPVASKSTRLTRHMSLVPPPSAMDTDHDQQQQKKKKTDAVRGTPTKREGFARFFGRAITKSASKEVEVEAVPSTSVPQPFAQHYQETSAVFLSIGRIHLSSKSKWSSQYREPKEKVKSKEKRTRFKDVDGDSDEDNFLYPGTEEQVDEERKRLGGHDEQRQLVNLSSLLDNAVLLEEFVKELAAILQVRRAIGIDAIHYP